MRRIGDLKAGDEVLFFLPKCSPDPLRYVINNFDYQKVTGEYLLDLDLKDLDKTQKYMDLEITLGPEDLERHVLIDDKSELVLLADKELYETFRGFTCR